MARPRLTPQEKKRLAQARDGVDRWGESQKGFRKVKPKRKAQVSRANRHAVAVVLHDGRDPAEEGVAGKRKVFWAAPRLGDVIEAKLQRRARLNESPRKSPAARQRRRLRRGKGDTRR